MLFTLPSTRLSFCAIHCSNILPAGSSIQFVSPYQYSLTRYLLYWPQLLCPMMRSTGFSDGRIEGLLAPSVVFLFCLSCAVPVSFSGKLGVFSSTGAFHSTRGCCNSEYRQHVQNFFFVNHDSVQEHVDNSKWSGLSRMQFLITTLCYSFCCSGASNQ